MNNPVGNYDFDTNLTDQGTINHLPTGGYDGGPCMEFVPTTTTDQYQMGYGCSSLAHAFDLNTGFIYFRWRMRFDDAYRWNTGGRLKFLFWGYSQEFVPPGVNFSRLIFYLDRPADNKVGALGSKNYSPPYTYGDGEYFPYAIPDYFDVVGEDDDWTSGEFGSLRAVVNIGNNAAGPICLHYGNRSPAVIPGPNSAAPVNGWYHIQALIQAGSNPNNYGRFWVNNNDFNNPTFTQVWWPDYSSVGEDSGLSTYDWANGFVFGPYVDTTQAVGQKIRAQHCEAALTFDPTWYPS
jgi:hypothetical protein